MEEDIEIVGVAGQTRDASALGGVTGITEFEELKYTGREWGFERLYSGEEYPLASQEVVELMVFNGVRGGHESWSIMRVRAGKDSRLTGPLSWRRVRNAERWSPAPVEAAIFTSWIKVGSSAVLIAATVYMVAIWALEGILSGGLVTTFSSATVSMAVIAGSLFYLTKSWRQVVLARKVARIQADGSMFVVGRPEGF